MRSIRFASLVSCVVVALLALTLTPVAVLAKKPAPPPPPPEPDPDPAIAYIQTVREGRTRTTKLMVMNDDGTNRTVVCPIATNPGTRVDWSPDGTRLVFAAWGEDDVPGIFVTTVDGTVKTRIATLTATPVFGPAWSPATAGETVDRIVFTDRDAGGRRDLFMVKADGTELVRLTTTPTLNEAHPTWSPLGTRIACKVTDDDDPYAQDLWSLYDFSRMPGDEYSVHHHTGALYGASAHFPTWSKTREDRIAWAVLDGDVHDLWIVDVDGDDAGFPLRVTQTSSIHERYVSWSPDDSQFVLASEVTGKGGGTDIETVHVDGSNREVLLEDASRPCWKRW